MLRRAERADALEATTTTIRQLLNDCKRWALACRQASTVAPLERQNVTDSLMKVCTKNRGKVTSGDAPLMTNWIDEAAKEVQDTRDRRALIDSGEVGLFEALWQEMTRHLAVAKSRSEFAGLKTNDDLLSRSITLESRTMVVSLDRAEHTIKSSLAGPLHVAFDVDICKEDHVVCLNQNGKRVSLEDAARMLLRPFLFTKLYEHAQRIYDWEGEQIRKSLGW